jgi:threonine dehydrogenase-like Zn-dependent dehydrogenase
VEVATGGRGADVALELVGSSAAFKLCFELLRPAGVLSSIGVHTDPAFPFAAMDAYNKNATLRFGRCPARHYMQQLVPLVQAQVAPFGDVITHRLPLREGVAAYHMFDSKLDGCIKVVLDPWA